ncbi:MAG: acetyl-CoA C-acetyltransferase [Smithellaceae bacterium]|jgi:acetyl-CoA C-acetyltransferase|nr:acetyl-CoA C-acetyltransferase [Syntrophaceae bacterium]MDX9815360.1 acetyl-CoA C-acetyltransferase [Smithellaceae bacterium]OPZ52766.1 MAG: Acetyl-CoA acetyltransferase [Deltaproteobacteria bacterium ADurb.BinA014]MBP8609037.1 acetyl-CoA C-acetyltransferase [Syntrophaceae bacterium]HNZ31037.1 acetyl-CoA C-acetyltransferase [Smithellaceae bacterium]
MKEVVIVSGARTAVGEFGGSLKGVKTVDLGALVIKESLRRAGLRPAVNDFIKSCRPDALGKFEMTEINKKYYDYQPSLKPVYIDEIIMGNVLQAGQGQNVARQACIYAGLPEETNAYTVNKVCASGLKAIALAAQAIMAGEAEIIVAGGMENMSNAPFAVPEARWGYRMSMPYSQITDLMVYDGLYEIFNGYHMGMTAENIAALYKISRQEQDEFSLRSHQRARAANASGAVADEIVEVVVPQKKGEPKIFKVDERPMDTSMEKMAKLPSVFKKNGTITAGNASGINDGAAAVVVMSADKARELNLEVLAKIRGWASGGVDPAYMGLGPIPATRKLFKKLNLTMKDMDLIELNEAFASQALACVRELGIDMEKCNLNGGGVSLGHPIGCSGARITYTLAMQMKKKNLKRGMASLCIGGGQGMSVVLERM